MYIFLILFFASLFCIIFMIGRKVSLGRSGQLSGTLRESPLFTVPSSEKIKYYVARSIRSFARTGLIVSLRIYIRSSNLVRATYSKVRLGVKNKFQKDTAGGDESDSGKPEVSKFLKMISDYKSKIRTLKHRIKEEENNS